MAFPKGGLGLSSLSRYRQMAAGNGEWLPKAHAPLSKRGLGKQPSGVDVGLKDELLVAQFFVSRFLNGTCVRAKQKPASNFETLNLACLSKLVAHGLQGPQNPPKSIPRGRSTWGRSPWTLGTSQVSGKLPFRSQHAAGAL